MDWSREFTRLMADALLMRMSIPPNVSTTFSMLSLTLCSLRMSHAMARAFPPAFSISAAAV
jgi:hypothetical protein